MKILVTGAGGFVGRNLVENLKNIKYGKDATRPGIVIEDIYEYGRADAPEDLERYCADCDFVFNLAGVNRPVNPEEFYAGNRDFVSLLARTLEKQKNACPVMLASSVQACLSGRYTGSEYGRSKLAGEEILFEHSEKTGSKALVYRFPNIVGKWTLPDYNSAIGTFCHNIAAGLPIDVREPEAVLKVIFIDDVINAMLDALEGRERRCRYEGADVVSDENGKYCEAAGCYEVKLGYAAELLKEYDEGLKNGFLPGYPADSFEMKLFSVFLSYLPEERAARPATAKTDERGSFSELLKFSGHGQLSVNVCRPGQVKGQHWHNSKWEVFTVVSGHGLIRQRKIGTDPATGEPFPVRVCEVTGGEPQTVFMLPGYTHELINLSDTADLVTVMWASEVFDPENPDTFYEPV